jgi:hypothetical protein
VAQNVANCQQKPANEAQTRELGKLPEEKQAEAWSEVIERTDGKPTAKAVKEVVDEALSDNTEESEDYELDEFTAPEPSHGFTPADTRDAYKDCKEAAKLEIENPSKANLKAFTESIYEMSVVTESRTVFHAKMGNLISTLGK